MFIPAVSAKDISGDISDITNKRDGTYHDNVPNDKNAMRLCLLADLFNLSVP